MLKTKSREQSNQIENHNDKQKMTRVVCSMDNNVSAVLSFLDSTAVVGVGTGVGVGNGMVTAAVDKDGVMDC